MSLRVSLINMPFAAPHFPSIALTQLKAVAEARLGDQVRIRILYLNQDFAQFLGLELYQATNGLQANNAGLGDWMFRRLAFPELPDNTDDYYKRYFPQRTPALEMRRRIFLEKRDGIERFFEGVISKYRLETEDVVGFTTMFAQSTASFALARLIKQKNPQVTTILGGANCESPMGDEISRHVPAIDYVFSGPALVSFPEFLEHRLAGDLAAAEKIAGVFTRDNTEEKKEGRERVGRELPIEVPVPLDYDEFLEQIRRNFGDRIPPVLFFETSRGCWWGERSHCTFCGLNGGTMGYRAMAPDRAIALFEELFQRYGDRCKRFDAVDNIMPREYLTEVFPYVKAPDGVEIFYEVKADLKDREMKVLGESGVSQIQPGIEALNSGTLKLMKKGVTSFQNLRFLKNCLRYGITPAWNLLIGFPREPEEVYAKYVADMPLLNHFSPPSGAFPVRFDRYSPYYTQRQEYGLELSPYAFYRFIYPFPEEVLASMAYYFEDQNYAAAYQANTVKWQEQLGKGTFRWLERFKGFDGLLPASLTLEPRGSGSRVRDTRSGILMVHEMSELETSILLDADANGWRTADIAAHLDRKVSEVEAAIERLRELGLIFEEGDRKMSVVLLDFDPQELKPEPLVASAELHTAHGAATQN